jgi:hypothetical protein
LEHLPVFFSIMGLLLGLLLFEWGLVAIAEARILCMEVLFLMELVALVSVHRATL